MTSYGLIGKDNDGRFSLILSSAWSDQYVTFICDFEDNKDRKMYYSNRFVLECMCVCLYRQINYRIELWTKQDRRRGNFLELFLINSD